MHRRRSAEGSFTPADIGALLCEQDGCCYYCGLALGNGYHVDHMTPLSRGGTNWPDNLALSCARCNLEKGAMTADEYLLRRAQRAA